jgi:hypothetical protein
MPRRGKFKVTDAPTTWKGLFTAGVGALVEIAKALHRIADRMPEEGDE